MNRSMARFLILALLFTSLCFGASAQGTDFLGKWYCISFVYEGNTYNPADLDYVVIFDFAENGMAEITLEGETGMFPWRVENGAPVVTTGSGSYVFKQDAEMLEMTDDGVVMRFGRESAFAPTASPAQEQGKEYWGKWRMTSFTYNGVAYVGDAMGTDMAYTFDASGSAVLESQGNTYAYTWSMENGAIRMVAGDEQLVFMPDGKNLTLSHAGYAMVFERASSYADTYKGSPLGSAKLLEGKTLLVTIFVDIEDSQWTWADFEAIRNKYALAKAFLETEAQRYGKDLEFIYDFEAHPDLIYKANAPAERFEAFWGDGISSGSYGDIASYTRFLGTIGLLNTFIEEMIPYQALADKYGTDSIAYCFQVKRWAPANFEVFYNPDILPDSSYHEKFILFDLAQWGAEALPHELLHTFGAVDLYLESPVNGVSRALVDHARAAYPNDIMGNWDEARVQDSIPYAIGPVTAYCLGWLDDIPETGMFPELKRHTPAAFYDHQRHVDPSLIGSSALPASGGSVRVNGIMEFAFTPDHADVWVLSSSDCGASNVWLEIYDSKKNSLGRSRMNGGKTAEGGTNVVYAIWLDAGETYYIQASFVDAAAGDNAKGSYTLTVATPKPLPGGGGQARAENGATAFYTFTPDVAGTYEIRHTDTDGAEVAYSLHFAPDDGMTTRYGPYSDKLEAWPAGEGYDDFISARLEAGETYLLVLNCMDDTLSYSVTITQK